MARSIQDFDGFKIAPDSDYPDGDIKDDTGSGDGTDMNRTSNADMQQFFAKMMRIANITPNHLPDNEYNGFQLIEALRIAASPCDLYIANISQNGTNDPTGIIFWNTITDPSTGIVGLPITWTRQGVGEYTGTGLGSLINSNRTECIMPGFENTGTGPGNITIKILPIGPSFFIQINTVDATNTPVDGILNDTSLEIKIFRESGTIF